MQTNSETLELTFEPGPETELEVEEFVGVPGEDTVANQLKDITVRFNKPIKEDSFTPDDLTLTCQSVTQDVSQIRISKVDERTYNLDLTEVTKSDGYYILTVQTAGIEDTEGYFGTSGWQASWVQQIMPEMLLRLAQGWNWVSSYLRDAQPLDSMKVYASRIVGQTDEAILDPKLGWVGNITTLQPGRTYKIQANSAADVLFYGRLYALDDVALDLQREWNWIAYPCHEIAPLAVLPAEEGDYLISQTGFAEYASGYWEGSFDKFIPGAGYLYKSVTNKRIVFDFPQTATTRDAYHSPVATHPSAIIDNLSHSYPNSMSLTARIYREGMELPAEHYTVYAFAGDELRGVSQCVGDNHYLTVYGDEPVIITFIVENNETGQQYTATPELTFVSDVVGSRKQPFAVNIGTVTGVDLQSDDSRPMTVYTLEGVLVSRDATLKQLRRLPKGVYIVNGQKCFVQAP